MKIAAVAAVIFCRALPWAAGPKAAGLAPPKAAPMSAPLPACSKTTATRKSPAMMLSAMGAAVISASP